jgi:Ca2+-binding EF-hand superfamily protein
MDTDSNNLVSLPEFQSGLSKVISLSAPIVEQLYHLLDANAVGLVNYEKFLDVLKTQKFTPV